MKRFLSLLLVVAMIVSLSLCCVTTASAKEADGDSGFAAIIAKYGKYFTAENISALVSAFNEVKENGISLDTATVTALVSGLADYIDEDNTLDSDVITVVVEGVAGAVENGITVDADTVTAIAAGLAGKLTEGTEFDPAIITAVIGAVNDVKENGIELDADTISAVVAGLAGTVDLGIEVSPETASLIVAAVADAFENGIEIDSDTIAAVAAGLAGKLTEGVEIDPAIITAVIEGVNDVKENGIELDADTVSVLVSALADKALEGTDFDPATVKALVAAIADIKENGFDLSSDAIQAVVRQMVGNETYAEIRVLFCKVTGDYPFTDIENSGYCDYILEAYYLGLVKGYSDDTFRPNQIVTRAQFVTMLWRAAGEPAVSGSLKFADRSQIASDYTAAVRWGVKVGVIEGYSDNTFRPNQSISRAQMATFVYRYMKNVEGYNFGTVAPLTFADKGAIASPYVTAVSAICSEGIMNGVSATKFDPNGTANRGMAATVILRMYKTLQE